MGFEKFHKEFNHGDVDPDTGEEWRDVVGYEGLYMISSMGRVVSLPKQTGAHFRLWRQLMSQKLTSCGYLSVSFKDGLRRKYPTVHCLVAKAFIENPSGKKFVNHINGNKQDNRVENLEWVTGQENMDHAVETGLLNVKGEMNPAAKLTKDHVLMIVKSKKAVAVLAKDLGVCNATIYHIRAGRVWTSVTGFKNIRKK